MKKGKKMHSTMIMVIAFCKIFAFTFANNIAFGSYSMDELIAKLKTNSTIESTTAPKVNFEANTQETGSNNLVLSDYVSKSVFDFGHDIGLNLLKTKPNSKYDVFSPISIVSSLNLLLLGAKGNTFEELLTVLKYGNYHILSKYPFTIHDQFSQLLKDLSSDVDHVQSKPRPDWKNTLFDSSATETYRNNLESRQPGNGKISIVNGLFIQKGYSVRQSYMNVAQSLYNCEIKNLDFYSDPSGAARYINDWVNQETRGLVPKIIGDTVASDTKVVIANSLYFKAEWLNEFLDGATGFKNFYPDGTQNQPTTVEMMANAGRFPYFESFDLDCRIMGFPYRQNETTMFIIIPNNSNREKLVKLQSELTFDLLENMINQMEIKTSVILLPKMALTSQYNLKDILTELGARSVFSPRMSDLSLISSLENSQGTTSDKIQMLQYNDARTMGSDTLHNQLIFSRISEDLEMSPKKRKRDITYKVKSDTSSMPLKFKDFLLNKRISKLNPDKKKQNRRHRRNISNVYLQELERLRYSNLQNPGIFANNVLHKVNLIVNEQGTEAAAATAVTINRSGPQVTFRVEVPFLIVIRHDYTKIPLFYGSVFEPSN